MLLEEQHAVRLKAQATGEQSFQLACHAVVARIVSAEALEMEPERQCSAPPCGLSCCQGGGEGEVHTNAI